MLNSQTKQKNTLTLNFDEHAYHHGTNISTVIAGQVIYGQTMIPQYFFNNSFMKSHNAYYCKFKIKSVRTKTHKVGFKVPPPLPLLLKTGVPNRGGGVWGGGGGSQPP